MHTNKKIKLFLVADGYGTIHSEILSKYLSKINYQVKNFFWKFLYHKDIYDKKKTFSFFYYLSKVDNHFIFGPITLFINIRFIISSIKNNYDIIFFHRATHINHLAVFIVKRFTSSIFISYNNDDPFSKKAKKNLWKNYIKSIKYIDHCFVYRKKNIEEHLILGCSNSSLLRSYYIPEFNFYIEENKVPLKFRSDVIFAGHFEDDNRDSLLLYLLNKGVNLKIYGSNWQKSIHYKEFLKFMPDIDELSLYDYNLALNGSKIALIFLSKLNNDTYTRRCFEIPLAKSMIISEKSLDIKNNLFTENSCIFFNSKNDLFNKINYYLDNNEIRKKIAISALKKVCNRDSIVNRVFDINEIVLKLLEKK